MIKIIGCKNEKEVAERSAELIAKKIKEKPDITLALATGSSPLGMYKELVKKNKSGEISFKNVKTVNLDEYVGLAPENDQSYRYFMNANLFNHVDIDIKNTALPSGIALDPEKETKRYDKVIAEYGGIDLQVLGIGNNGHIGFNEPSDCFSKTTQHVKLTESTIEANSRFFKSRKEVPTHALTMGIGQIMAAEEIILIALGKGKASILQTALFGEVTPRVPASILQFFKGLVLVYADEDALSVIKKTHPDSIA